MTHVNCFNEGQLEAICKCLADTSTGLTGSEIERVLIQCGVTDINPNDTKWRRLYSALMNHQNQKQYGNHIIVFIQKSMAPARFISNENKFNHIRSELNIALSLCGYYLDEKGKIHPAEIATTISEAKQRADRLRVELERRGVHKDVLEFCQERFLQKDYFYAVLEATKSVADKIRKKSGINEDGTKLIDQAFEKGQSYVPHLAFNLLRNSSEWNEHKGIMQLIRGLFSAFRNPTAHESETYWSISETDALDVLTIASLIHRRLDKVYNTQST